MNERTFCKSTDTPASHSEALQALLVTCALTCFTTPTLINMGFNGSVHNGSQPHTVGLACSELLSPSAEEHMVTEGDSHMQNALALCTDVCSVGTEW